MLQSKKFERKETMFYLPSLLGCRGNKRRSEAALATQLSVGGIKKAKVLRKRGLGEYLQEHERHDLSIPCHKNILAGASSVFEAMIGNKKNKEAEEGEVDMNNLGRGWKSLCGVHLHGQV